MRNRMKKTLIASLLTVIGISSTACNGTTNIPSENNENSTIGIIQNSVVDTEQMYLEELNRIQNKGNAIYSPTSTRTALQMFEYMTTSEQTQKDISELLNDVNYLNYEDNEAQRFVNRVWINSNKDVEVSDKLKDFVYKIDMSDSVKATKEKNNYVAQQTNDFITSTPTIFTEQTRYDLMNITYFKDQWAVDGGYTLNDEKLKFKNNNDEADVKEVSNFFAHTNRVYENKTVYVAELDYKNGNTFSIVYPKTKIEDVSLDNLRLMQDTEANLTIPEFEMENTFDLTGTVLITDEENIDMVQVAKIKVDKEGTEAAAVTEIVKCESAVMEEPKVKILDLVFDKPFVYYITDRVNNDIIFIGRLVEIQ